MPDNCLITVIIPTYKRPKMVEALILNIGRQVLAPCEVLVVDSSEDGFTKEVCEALQNQLPFRLIYMKSEKGLTKQRNIGIEKSIGKFIVMLDDDVLLEENFLKCLIGFLREPENSNVGGVSGYIINQWGKEEQNWWTSALAKLGFFPEKMEPGRYLDWGYPVELSYLKVSSGNIFTDFIPGGCTMWRREVFECFRPNTDIFTYGGEDKEFSLRVKRKYRLAVVCDALVEHFKVAGGARKNPFTNGFYTVRNWLYIYINCFENPSFFKKLKLNIYFGLDSARMFLASAFHLQIKTMLKAVGITCGTIFYFFVPPK
jgi:glucosyl-dolichyl phosphate glucuronosyltransferase